MLQLEEGKKMIFFLSTQINFQVLLLVVAFDNISMFIFLRQSAFDSMFGIVL